MQQIRFRIVKYMYGEKAKKLKTKKLDLYYEHDQWVQPCNQYSEFFRIK